MQASSVLDAMRFRLSDFGVEVHSDCRVKGIEKGFKIICQDGKVFSAKRVIVACGGAAMPKTGSDGSGAKLLESLGHTINPLLPAVVQLKTDTTYTKQLKGIKIDAEASVYAGDDVLQSSLGEVLFTDYGLSGPPILELSREAVRCENAEVSIDIMPTISRIKLVQDIVERSKILKGRELAEFFTGMINKRLGQVIIKSCELSLHDKLKTLTLDDAEKLAKKIKDFRFKVYGNTGFANAQTTAGGAKTSEFDKATLESEIVDGLYATGEVLDIDGDCGGYNLHWAWASGILAGMSAAGK